METVTAPRVMNALYDSTVYHHHHHWHRAERSGGSLRGLNGKPEAGAGRSRVPVTSPAPRYTRRFVSQDLYNAVD